MPDGPLTGIKVLEYGQGVAAAHAAKIVGDLGADVIKVEDPDGGDPARRVMPFLGDDPNPEKSGFFLYLNTNKRGVTVDLETPDGRAIFQKLVGWADVLFVDLPRQRLSELGLEYDALQLLNDQLVYAAITPFGLTGPKADWKGTDLIMMNAGGLAYITPPGAKDPDQPPLKPAGHHAAQQGSLNAVIGVLAALWARPAIGRGQLVDISQQECLASILEAAIQYFTYRGIVRSRFNPFFVQPLMVLPATDGYIYCCIVEQAQWERFVELLGNPDWATSGLFDTMIDRVENVDALEVFLTEFTSQHDVQWLYRETQARRIPWAPVNTMETLAKSEHLAARGFFVKIDRPLVGELTYPGAPYDFQKSPWQLRRPAPLLGEHTAEVLTDLGYQPAEIVRLREAGVI